VLRVVEDLREHDHQVRPVHGAGQPVPLRGRITSRFDDGGNRCERGRVWRSADQLQQHEHAMGIAPERGVAPCGHVLPLRGVFASRGSMLSAGTQRGPERAVTYPHGATPPGPPRLFSLSFLGFSISTKYCTYRVYLLTMTKATTNLVKTREDVPQKLRFFPNAGFAIRSNPPILMRWPCLLCP